LGVNASNRSGFFIDANIYRVGFTLFNFLFFIFLSLVFSFLFVVIIGYIDKKQTAKINSRKYHPAGKGRHA